MTVGALLMPLAAFGPARGLAVGALRMPLAAFGPVRGLAVGPLRMPLAVIAVLPPLAVVPPVGLGRLPVHWLRLFGGRGLEPL